MDVPLECKVNLDAVWYLPALLAAEELHSAKKLVHEYIASPTVLIPPLSSFIPPP